MGRAEQQKKELENGNIDRNDIIETSFFFFYLFLYIFQRKTDQNAFVSGKEKNMRKSHHSNSPS